jgi:hypothetical protein
MRLENRVAVITGAGRRHRASGGIGPAAPLVSDGARYGNG